MAKTEKCPECGTLFDPRGLKTHRASAHGVADAKPNAAPSTTATAPVVDVDDEPWPKSDEAPTTPTKPAAKSAWDDWLQ